MMLRVILLLTLTALFIYMYGPVLFSRAPLFYKLKRIPGPTAVFAILILVVGFGFQGEPEHVEPQVAEIKQVPEVVATSAIAQPVVREPLQPKDAAAACVERALDEARATEDLVAVTWLSSVEGFLETAPGEVTVQFAVGPRAGPPKGPQCRTEARLTCAVADQDVRPITPIHMTGAKISC